MKQFLTGTFEEQLSILAKIFVGAISFFIFILLLAFVGIKYENNVQMYMEIITFVVGFVYILYSLGNGIIYLIKRFGKK